MDYPSAPFTPPQIPTPTPATFYKVPLLQSFCFVMFQRTHPLEAACEVELALHHVEEDGDSGLSQLNLRN